jgi:nucleotide-binding universal stress UspA family protein
VTQLSAVFPVVVAVTGDAAAAAALCMTDVLAREHGAVPTVVRVVHDAFSMGAGASATGAMVGVPEAALDPAFRNRHLAALEAQVKEALGTLPPWRYDVEAGATVPAIVQRVRDLHAELVILGLPQHNFFRRAFVRDTVQGVIEQSRTAVLALRPELTHRPASILAAVDFGAASLRAAHMACQLVAPGGHVMLVYVHAERPHGANTDVGVETALTALIDELSAHKAITVTSIIEHGNSIAGVKDVAMRMRPHVVALGTREHSQVDWFFGDSVSTEFVDERHWSLLVVPE